LKVFLIATQTGGGIGTFAQGLADALPQAMPASDELVVLRPRGTSQTRVERFWREQVRLPRAVRSADLIHLCDFRPIVLSRRPFVLTIHDVFFFDHPDWFPPSVGAYKRAIFKAALRKHPAAVVCTTAYVRDTLLADFPSLRERTRVIQPGVSPVAETITTAVAEGDYFLTVSTIEPRKNYLGLLEGFMRARASGFPLRWKVVGGPGYRSREIVAALREAEGVDLVGYVEHGELDRLYAAARFVASPSLAEGFGFPVLEAFGRGVPVVCSRGSGLDETVGEAALRVAADAPDEWAQALIRLGADESLRASFAARGHEQVAKFEWKATAQAYVECYRSVASGS